MQVCGRVLRVATAVANSSVPIARVQGDINCRFSNVCFVCVRIHVNAGVGEIGLDYSPKALEYVFKFIVIIIFFCY